MGRSARAVEDVAPRFAWSEVGPQLLEHSRLPAVLVDRRGQLVSANAAFRFHLARGALKAPVQLARDWVPAADRARFLAAFAQALTGKTVRVTVPLSVWPPTFEPTFELEPVRPGRRVVAVVLVMVASHPPGDVRPVRPALGLHYELEMGADGRPVRVLDVCAADEVPAPAPDAPCHTSLYGRQTPCPWCPFPLPAGVTATERVHLDAAVPFRARLVAARPGVAGSYRVSTVALDGTHYGALIKLRTEALARQAQLTDREGRVLQQLLAGRTLAEIGHEEHLTARTVKYHQQNLLRKLGADSRLDLLRLIS